MNTDEQGYNRKLPVFFDSSVEIRDYPWHKKGFP